MKTAQIKQFYAPQAGGDGLRLCKCDCGNELEVFKSNLHPDRKGCPACAMAFASETRTKPESFSEISRSLAVYRSRAVSRRLCFDLTREQFAILARGNCYYCGALPDRQLRWPGARVYTGTQVKELFNGVDRLDSSLGYTLENCVPCCKYCNRAKSDLSLEQFLRRVHAIAKRHLCPL